MTTNGTPGVASGTQAVDRALRLLSLVVRAEGAVTFTDLCADTGYARSTTSRLLAALERSALIGRDGDGGWVPGRVLVRYAARHGHDDDLARTALPFMEELGELTGETVNLGAARGGTVIHIGQVASTYILASRDWVGVEVPPHLSALGKVLYAYHALGLPSDPLEAPTTTSIATVSALRAEFPAIKARRYATTVDELEIGLSGIAAPVLVDEVCVAALGLSGPTARLAKRASSIGPVVARQADALSAQITRHRKDGAA